MKNKAIDMLTSRSLEPDLSSGFRKKIALLLFLMEQDAFVETLNVSGFYGVGEIEVGLLLHNIDTVMSITFRSGDDEQLQFICDALRMYSGM